MLRWITPPAPDNPRYSNGWWAHQRDGWMIFGNGSVDRRRLDTGATRTLGISTQPHWPAGLSTIGGKTIAGITIQGAHNFARGFGFVNLDDDVIVSGFSLGLPFLDPETMPTYYANGRVWGVRDGQYYRDGQPFTFTGGGRVAGPPEGAGRYLVLAQPDRNWEKAIFDGETGALVEELTGDVRLFELIDGYYLSALGAGVNTVRRLDGTGEVVFFPNIVGADWQDVGVPVMVVNLWLWTPAIAGLNEQGFIVGRRAADPDGIVLEMPIGYPSVSYRAATDEFVVNGMAQGMHGTPDYRDGEMHVITVGADAPRRSLRSLVTPFDYPVRIPDRLTFDVWTFGDFVTGTIGGGKMPSTKRQRQGLGLWSARDAALGFGTVDTPWLPMDHPEQIIDVWLSPWDSSQRLREFVTLAFAVTQPGADWIEVGDAPTDDEPTRRRWANLTRFELFVVGHKLDELLSVLTRLALEQLTRNAFDLWPIERTMAIQLCLKHGWSATIYSDHQDFYNQDTNRAFFDPRVKRELVLMRRIGVACLAGMNLYPGGMATWALPQAIDDIRLDFEFTNDDGTVTPERGFAWTAGVAAFTGRDPVTGKMRYAPTGMARQLEWALPVAQAQGASCLDVFGVGGRLDPVDVDAWVRGWVATVRDVATPDAASWPRTTIPAPPVVVEPPPVEPPPVVPVTPDHDGGLTGKQWAVLVGIGVTSVTALMIARAKHKAALAKISADLADMPQAEFHAIFAEYYSADEALADAAVRLVEQGHAER
jgi:hypothetical protein